MSASLPSEELPRRVAGPAGHTLLVKLAADMAWPLPLTGLVNLPIGPWDDLWPEEPASASGQTDGNQQTDKPMKLKLNNVRLSYPALFEPKAGPEGGDPKYSAAFIMDRDNNAPEITAIRDGILAVAKDTWGEPNVKWHDGKLMLKKSDGKALIVKTCLRDGAEKPDSPELDNAMFFNASSKNPVPVVDRDPRVHLNAASGRPYGGCYVNASVRLWVQDNAFGKRVNCALAAVQFSGEGKAFGDAPVDPESEFSNLEGEKPQVSDNDGGPDLPEDF